MRGCLRLMAALVLLASSAAAGIEQRLITTDSGAELTVDVYPARQGPRVIWIHSEFGLGGGEATAAEELAALGIEVWQLRVHDSYFLVAGRGSYREVPPEDLAALVEQAADDDRAVYLLAAGRGAALALEAANRWQRAHPGDRRLKGAVLISPNLLSGSATPGSAPEYQPIALANTLPLFLMQPELSGKHYYLAEITKLLGRNGAPVYTQRLPEVSDGFHSRPEITDPEAELRTRLPALIRRGLSLLATAQPAAAPPPPVATQPQRSGGGLAASLQPFQGDPSPPPLTLADLEGRTHALDGYRGKVVLLNFWATWCPPCVKELPSLERLRQRFEDRSFAIVTVDVGEDAAQVGAFLERHGIDIGFPVLLDPDGVTVEDWRLVAFPTSFVLDRDGAIRYGLFGALEWDGEEIVDQIERLIDEPA